MSRSLSTASGGSTPVGVYSLKDGGTGATSASAALAALGAVAAVKKGAASGVLPLDSSGQASADYFGSTAISAIGVINADAGAITSNTVAVSTTNTYVISNYDSFTKYSVSLLGSGGAVSISGKYITYTAPASAGSAGFVINGKKIPITVVSSLPVKPTAAITLAGSTASQQQLTINTTAFSTTPSSALTHHSTDWEISTDTEFFQKTYTSYTNTTSKTQLVATVALTANQTYYARCRFRDSNSNVGSWSDTVSIVGLTDYTPDAEVLVFDESTEWDRTANNGGTYNYSNSTGKFYCTFASITTTVSTYANAGVVYFYEFSSTGAKTLKQTIQAPDPVANANFGRVVSMLDDMSRLFIGAPGALNGSGVATGAIYVYTYNGTSWVYEAKLVGSDLTAGSSFLHSSGSSITKTGDRVVGGSTAFNSNKGALYVFSRTGTTWTQEAKILDSNNATANRGFGSAHIATATGDRVFANCYNQNNGAVTQTGSTYIFRRSGTTWTQEAQIDSPYVVTGAQFGLTQRASPNGDYYLAYVKEDYSGLTAPGKVYAYTRSSTTWSSAGSFVSPVPAANGLFGNTVLFSPDYTKMFIGEQSATVNGLLKAGALHYYKSVSGSWQYVKKLTQTQPVTNGSFQLSVMTDTLDKMLARSYDASTSKYKLRVLTAG